MLRFLTSEYRLLATLGLLLFLAGCVVDVREVPKESTINYGGGNSEKLSATETIGTKLETGSSTTVVLPLSTPTATRSPQVTHTNHPPPTQTAFPTATREVTTTPSLTPTPQKSPTPESNLTATEIAKADSVVRSCPQPPPGKPDYEHYFLSGELWIKPDSTLGNHLWLAKPLPGGGRLLYTDWLPFGYDAGGRYLLHNGLDSAEPLGTPVLAAADGIVVYAGKDDQILYGWRCDWYGELVAIEIDQKWLGQPVYLIYGHVLNITVQTGERVERGQQIAEVGFGGAASLPHLHFEVRVSSNEFNATRNPLLWIQPPQSRGVIAGRLVDPEGRPWQGVTVAAVGRSGETEILRTWSYLGDPLNIADGDEVYGENFVFGDVKPGEYEIYIDLQGKIYQKTVIVEGGQIETVEIITEPYQQSSEITPASTSETIEVPTPGD